MLGKEEWGVPGNSGYCILMLGTKMKEERSKILWNNITNCWNLQEAVTFIEYRRRMPAVSPMCLKSRGTEPWQSKKRTILIWSWTLDKFLNLCWLNPFYVWLSSQFFFWGTSPNTVNSYPSLHSQGAVEEPHGSSPGFGATNFPRSSVPSRAGGKGIRSSQETSVAMSISGGAWWWTTSCWPEKLRSQAAKVQ